jgi:superoxide dismutase, Cu-Zn family
MPSRFLVLGIALAVLAACATRDRAQPPGEREAVAQLKPTQGNTTSGTVWFEQQGDHVIVNAQLTGLPPDSLHGFHVHEKGDCSAPDAGSAGGHFNPHSDSHGDPLQKDHHAGDMWNVRSDANGNANYRAIMPEMSLAPGSSSVIGKSVIVHLAPDDYHSQPAGNSGPRIACGVIAASERTAAR